MRINLVLKCQKLSLFFENFILVVSGPVNHGCLCMFFQELLQFFFSVRNFMFRPALFFLSTVYLAVILWGNAHVFLEELAEITGILKSYRI